ncbi:MAG TPA: hypothetical protein VFW40_00895 [Capsulimonadaceae bacterium]|nr:hypothetical protein [Capsulimonadaceae bacterium]
MPKEIDQYELSAISPVEVKITAKSHIDSPMEARFVDGKWRIDLGGVSDLLNAS